MVELAGRVIVPRLGAYLDRLDALMTVLDHEAKNETVVRSPRYHFTTVDTLRKIISGRELWFTDVRSQHDPSELRHGLDLALGALHHVSKMMQDGRVTLLLDCTADLINSNPLDRAFRYYLLCFGKGLQDINQWVRYADDGAGCAISFAPSFFTEVPFDRAMPPQERFFCSPVYYPAGKAPKRITAVVTRFAQLFQQAANEEQNLMANKLVGWPFLREFAGRILGTLLLLAVTTKNRAYASERETRLVMVGEPAEYDPYVRVFERGAQSIPFVAHPFKPAQAISAVVIGPAAHCRAQEEMHEFLDSVGLAHVHVQRSAVPYRSFKHR